MFRQGTGPRYGSAEALAEDLERWLKGEPVRARSISITERVWKWAKRSPGWALFFLIAVFATICLTVVAALLMRREEARTASLWVIHSHNVISQAVMAHWTLQKTEIEERDYLITGSEVHLAACRTAAGRVEHEFTKLWNLTADNPEEHKRAEDLIALVAAELRDIDATLAQKGQHGAGAAVARFNARKGQNLFDKICKSLDELLAQEERLLNYRNKTWVYY